MLLGLFVNFSPFFCFFVLKYAYMTKNNQELLLQNLKIKILKDKKMPLLSSNLVFGEGSARAKIVFIGEAPGANEDRESRPFVGRSGKLLTTCLEEIGLKREDVYITNIVKRRPPENRDPLPEEIEAYRPYLKKQLEIIDPQIIITLGRFALNYFISDAKISREQGQVFKLEKSLLIPMFHPAAALRGTKVLNQFKKSFKKIARTLKLKK